MGALGGGRTIQLWVPAKGPVTWPDRSPAGTYIGTKRYRHVVEDGDRICVAVHGIAARVCHPKQTAKQETGMAYLADD